MRDLKKCVLLRAAEGVCVYVQLDVQDVFIREAIPVCRCLQGLTMEGHVVSGVCVTTICSVCRE